MMTMTAPVAHGAALVNETAMPLSDAAFGFSAKSLRRAECLRISADKPFLYRYDGGEPTRHVGHYAPAHQAIELTGQASITNLQLRTAGEGPVHVAVTLEARPIESIGA